MFSFAAPIFLWGLTALALPLIAHLINRETKRTLDFPSLRFLRQSKLPQTGRRMPRDLLLLLLRLALLALIVLALARPKWTPQIDPAAVVPLGQRDQVAIVLDASASMQGWGNWERAQARVTEILKERKGAVFAFVGSARGAVVTVPLSEDPAAVTQAMRALQPSLVAGQHRDSIQAAAAQLTGTGRKSLYLVSDFQQTDWREVAPTGWDPAVQVELADIGPAAAERENVAIMSARTVPLAEGGKRVLVELRNFGAKTVKPTVQAEVGETRRDGEIEIEPGATRSLVFDMKTEPGSQRGRVTLGQPDAYLPDNELFFWAGEPPALPILAVTPEGEAERSQALIFLQAALGVRAQPSWLTFVIAPTEANLFYGRDLEGARGLLLLGSAGQLPRNELSALKDFAEKGGVILATPGREASLAFRALSDAGLLNSTVRGEERMGPEGRPFRIEPLKPGNPLLELFPADTPRDLYLWRIYRYIRLQVDEPDAHTLIAGPGGAPLLLRKPIGKGTLLVAAFDLDAFSSDLPLRGSFLPLVRELIVNSLPSEPGIARLGVGDVPTSPDLSGLETLSLEQRRLLDTSKPSVVAVANVPIEVNVSRLESLPVAADLLELAAEFQGGPGSEPVSAALAQEDTAREEMERRTIDLAPWAALVAMLLFIAEMPITVWLSGRKLAA
jgi:hypothetical protein